MKGIILAGGTGSRLFPLTLSLSKQLLPIYDKPMIYYPFSILMLAGIREILVVVTPEHYGLFVGVLGDGSNFGVNVEYAIQKNPGGIPEAFTLGAEFIGSGNVCLILGDNIFWGQGLTPLLQRCTDLEKGAFVVGHNVTDPERYGVAEFDKNDRVLKIHEKPAAPTSNCAITGLYFYDNDVVDIASEAPVGSRGEKEITWVNNQYVAAGTLKLERLGRGVAWLDTGTHSSLLQASAFVETIEARQGLKIACLEEIALDKGWISNEELIRSPAFKGSGSYSTYLQSLVEE